MVVTLIQIYNSLLQQIIISGENLGFFEGDILTSGTKFPDVFLKVQNSN